MVKLNTRRRRDVCWKSCQKTKFCRFSIFGIFADHKFAKQKVSTLQLHSDEKGSQSERDATQKVKSDADERDRSTSVCAWLWFSIHEVKRGGFGGEKGWNWIDGRVHCGTWNDQLDVDADDVIFVELVALVIFVLISQWIFVNGSSSGQHFDYLYQRVAVGFHQMFVLPTACWLPPFDV